jgi:hypothetical protein
MLNFIITIIVVLIFGGLALIAPDRIEAGKKILACVSTVALFYALGTTVYWFLNFIMAAVIMYFYIGSKNTEEVWLKIIVFAATMGLIWHWRDLTKEGFNVSPLKYISSDLTAKQCQDVCEGSLGCKYAQVPLATSQSGSQNKCSISYGFNQSATGSKNQGGDTWTNKLWKAPITVNGSYNGTISTSGAAKVVANKSANMIPQEVSLSVDIKDQGWGNATWGIYIEGSGPSGIVFKQAILAPRSSSTITYPTYSRRSFRTAQKCVPISRIRDMRGNNTRMPWGRTKNEDYNLWVSNCSRISFSRCFPFWPFFAGKGRCERGGGNVGYRNVFTGWGSRTVQGPLLGRSQTWKINTNNTITSIKVYAATRGQGHALTARSIKWSVKGWP